MGAEISIFRRHHRTAHHRGNLFNIDPLILDFTKPGALLHHVKRDRRIDPSVDQSPSQKGQRRRKQAPKQNPPRAAQQRPQSPRPSPAGAIRAIKMILNWLNHRYATPYQRRFVNLSEARPEPSLATGPAKSPIPCRAILPAWIGIDHLAKALANAPAFLWGRLAQNCAFLLPNAAKYPQL